MFRVADLRKPFGREPVDTLLRKATEGQANWFYSDQVRPVVPNWLYPDKYVQLYDVNWTL